MNEKTIKRLWLLCLGLQLLTPFLITEVLIHYLSSNPLLIDHLQSLTMLAAGLLYEVIFAIALLFYAYRRPGTTLLMISLLGAVWNVTQGIFYIGQLQAAQLFVSKLNLPQVNSLLIIAQFVGAFYIANSIAWFYLCFNLRRINKKTQIEQIRANPTYQPLLYQIESAETTGELVASYAEAVRNHPQIAWYLKKIYEKKMEMGGSCP